MNVSSFSPFFSSDSSSNEENKSNKYDIKKMDQYMRKMEEEDFRRIVKVLRRIYPHFNLEDLIHYKLI